MNNHQLDKLLYENPYTKRYFIGTYPEDFETSSRKSCYSFITNTQPYSKRGEHWCAWWIENDRVTFFDSFGRPPTHHTFPPSFTQRVENKQWRYVAKAVQLPGTSSCGQFCLHFLLTMSSGMTVDDFLKYYKNVYMNDDIVQNYKTLDINVCLI